MSAEEMKPTDSEMLEWLMADKRRHVGHLPEGWVAFFHSSPLNDPLPTFREAIAAAMNEAGLPHHAALPGI